MARPTDRPSLTADPGQTYTRIRPRRSAQQTHRELGGVIHELEERGHRLTPRLAVVADVADAGVQFSAEEIAVRLKGRGIGRATVFRTLKLLVEPGVLCRVSQDGGTLRYRRSTRGHHHDLVCTECGAVQVLTACDVAEVVQGLSREADVAVDAHWLEVYGRCSTCRAAAPALVGAR